MEKFIPLNDYILFEEVEQKRSKFEHTTTNVLDKVPRGRVVAVNKTKHSEIDEGDEFLYRTMQEVPNIIVNNTQFKIVKFEQVYGKYEING